MSNTFDIEISSRIRVDELGKLEQQLQREIVRAQAAGQAIEAYSEKVSKLAQVQEQLKSLTEHQEGQNHRAEQLGEIKEKLGEIQSLVPGLSTAVGGVNSVVETAGKLATGPLGAVAAGLTAVAAAGEAVKEGVKEFSNTEKVVTDLDRALARSGHLTDEVREKYQEIAETLEKKTGKKAEEYLSVMARLTKFGAQPNQMEGFITSVRELAVVTGTDIETAGRLFQRAMNGNFTALTRYGISVEKSGDKQKMLLDLQEKLHKMGGTLGAEQKTLALWFDLVARSTDNFFKGIGNLISRTGILQAVMQGFVFVMEKVNGVLPHTVERLKGLQNQIGDTEEPTQDATDSIDGLQIATAELGGQTKETKDEVGQYTQKINDLVEAYDKATAAAKRQEQQELSMVDAEAGLALAKIEARAKTDKTYTPLQQESDKFKVKQDSEAKKFGITRAGDIASIQRQQKLVGQVSWETQNAEGAVELARRSKAATEADYDTRIKAIEDEQKRLQKAEDTAKAYLANSKAVQKAYTEEISKGYVDETSANKLDSLTREVALWTEKVELIRKAKEASSSDLATEKASLVKEKKSEVEKKEEELSKATKDLADARKADAERTKKAAAEIEETRSKMKSDLDLFKIKTETAVVTHEAEQVSKTKKDQEEEEKKAKKEQVRALENKIKEAELAGKDPTELKRKKIDLEVPSDATPEQKIAAELEKKALKKSPHSNVALDTNLDEIEQRTVRYANTPAADQAAAVRAAAERLRGGKDDGSGQAALAQATIDLIQAVQLRLGQDVADKAKIMDDIKKLRDQLKFNQP